LDDHLQIARSLAIAVLTGALIGLEREYHHRLKDETGFAGLRTFTFFAVLGKAMIALPSRLRAACCEQNTPEAFERRRLAASGAGLPADRVGGCGGARLPWRRRVLGR